ncbi:unnamed protein product [Protopolystoma xenopodis]|uniref:Major facilitator superfamily associated domain-containing protein n=1 Tax=Protopolystoma xenopodis TaxID=117903 RepID=A0A3S5CUZ4_9PLAT|nr:unnamed protein product [Protopolystoma xenopodis]
MNVRDSTKKFAYIDNLFRTRRNLSIIHDNETPCSSRGLGRRLFTIASYRNRGYSPMMSKSYESNCQNIRQNFFKGTNFHHHQAFLNHGMNTSSNMHENEDFPNLSNEKLYRSLSLDELAKKENSICSPGVPPNSLSKLRILSDLNLNALPFDSMQASRCHSDPELYLVLTLQSHAPADQVLPDNPEVSGCHVRPSVDSPIHTCNKVSLLQINEQLEAKFQWPFCFQMGCPPDPEPDATRSIDGLTSVSRILSVYRSSRSRDKICGYDEDDRNDEEDEESEFEGQTQLCSPFATTSTFSTRVNLPARSARPGPCDPVDAFYPGSLSAAFARQPRRHPLPRRPLLASCSMPELTDSVSAGRHTTISDILLSIWLKCMIRPFCACMRCPSSLSSSMKSSISETNTGNSFSVSPAEGSWCGNVFGARAISCCYCHFLRSLLSRSWNHATDSHSSINKAFLFGMTSSLFPGVVISSTASSHPLIPISCNTVAQLSIEPTELDRISRSRQSRVTCGRKKRSLRRTRSLLSVSMTKVRLDILTKMLDLTVFRSPAFCLFLASNGLLFFWYNVTFFFMSLRAEQQAGISDVLSAYLLSVLGVANMIGEVLVGCLADCEGVDTLLLYIICMLICGVSTTMQNIRELIVT